MIQRDQLMCIVLIVACVFLGVANWYQTETKKLPVYSGPLVTEVMAELNAGCPGILVFEGADGQCLRMWQMPHRMEEWLMNQKKIRIEDMYYFDHRTSGEPASIRYYVRYQVLKENP